MNITDQEEIMSFARERCRDNPEPSYVAIDWNGFRYHNATEPQKILIMAESDESLSDAIDILYVGIKYPGDIESRTVIFGLSEITPFFTINSFSTAGSPPWN